MKDIKQQPSDFASAFESAFAMLQVSVETACVAKSDFSLAAPSDPRASASHRSLGEQ